MQVLTGLEVLAKSKTWQKKITGNIAYLCHSASIDQNFRHGIEIMQQLFKGRLKCLFGPQHGIITDVQDNMVESPHQIHPHFKLPVYSLYGETRRPTQEMLHNIDTLIIDLQDVGTRVYTYITTMDYCLALAEQMGIQVIILDRPNPAGGILVEGRILDPTYQSFVGAHPLPMRHGMTIGEVGRYFQQNYYPKVNLTVISLKNYCRAMFWPFKFWVNPSPNLATPDSAITFAGTVLLEGTQVSEGRGTTRPLEVVGHHQLEPYAFTAQVAQAAHKAGLKGFMLRPCAFRPMFQKEAGMTCGGFQIHVTHPAQFRAWRLGQIILRELTSYPWFKWKDPPYEYEYQRLPIDMINGGPELRRWAEGHGSDKELQELEQDGLSSFLKKRRPALIYK